ncbi:MAG: hypothetical protein R3Y16_02485 [Rikenellaceae bacterium]
MKRLLTTLSLSVAIALSSCSSEAEPQGLEFIFDGVHDTPMEGATITKYNDPAFLIESGYNGMTPHWHVQCGLTYDSFEKGIIPEGSAEREWILNKQKEVRQLLKEAKDKGIKVYPFIDICVLPTIIIEKYQDEIVRSDHSGVGVLHGKMAPDINKPLTQKLIRAQISEIFETYPELDGLVTRVGETYLFDTPYHSGGSPVGVSGEQGRVDGHIELLKMFRDEICVNRDKMLFYRTWDFMFLHTRKDIFERVTSQIEPHKNLCFSIKYSEGDFHRLTRFNPTIGVGDHGYIIEFQCQPEYYGKGAHPVNVFSGMLNGFTEYEQNMKGEHPYRSVSDLKKDPKFRGLWSWSRGGGWRGPFLENELWCDVNAQAMTTWARDTTLTESEVLHRSLARMGVKSGSVEPFIEMIHKADDGVVKGQCSLIDVGEYYFKTNWARDQYVGGEGDLSQFMNYIVDNNKGEQMLAEKDEAVEIWREIEALSRQIEMNSAEDEEFVRISASYGRIKYELFREIFRIYYYAKLEQKRGVKESEKMRAAIANYDALWSDWQTLVDSSPQSATIYEPNAFKLGDMVTGVTGNENTGVAASVDKYRSW